MKTVINRLAFKKVLTFCLISLPLFFLTGCSNLLTPETLTKMLNHGSTAGGVLSGIGIVSSLAESAGQCWACTVFVVTWNAIGEAFEKTYALSAQSARLLLAIALLFWLTLTIGKMVIQIKQPNLKDYIPKIAGTLFKAACVGVVLSSPAFLVQIINIFMEPILTGTVYIARLVLPNDLDMESTLFAILRFLSTPASILGGFLEESIDNHPVFTKQIGETLRDVIYNLFEVFKGGFLLGGRMMFQVDPMAVASGGLILCTFFYFMFYFPLLLLEGFAALGVILILFPVFMVGWVFPSTKGYMSEAIKVIFQSVAQILITCIYIGIILAIIDANEGMLAPTKMLTDPVLITGIGNMNNNGLAFFGMIFCLLKLTNDIPNITSYFVGEMNKSIIAKTFSKMQNIMKNSAKMVIGTAMAGTGVLSSVGKVMVAEGARDASREAVSMGTNDSEVSSGDIREQTKQQR
ncbi:MAG: hypothetical protein J6V53_03440 [Alphaproteobacteria bacterium]|nr:hypothetical protein [Alphaproteobacteria bacterium]